MHVTVAGNPVNLHYVRAQVTIKVTRNIPEYNP